VYTGLMAKECGGILTSFFREIRNSKNSSLN